jgi:hypothetical protein
MQPHRIPRSECRYDIVRYNGTVWCFSKANTYGKTFHTWQVDRGDVLPLGPPQLMMSATADGQVKPTLHVRTI